MNTIFPVTSLDRSKIRWEDYLHVLTPWENHAGVWFKRDDYFSPLGYGGPNGGKLRQLIWFFDNFRSGKDHVLSGASIQSPQLSSSAVVAAHFNMPVYEIVYSKPSTVLTHANPRVAYGFGAEFIYANGPYNPIIQNRVNSLRKPTSLVVEYGITVPHDRYSVQDVRGFMELGSHQVSNLPDEVQTLIMPAGSCNSLISVIYGLVKNCRSVKTLYTIGIGPDKRAWVHERLALVGIDSAHLPLNWQHFSLHESGYSKYSDHFDGECVDGISFHPTYEAKMWRWLKQTGTLAALQDAGGVGFWIVGGAVDVNVTEPYYTRRW